MTYPIHRQARPTMARAQWRPSYRAPRSHQLAQAEPSDGRTAKTVEAGVDTAIFAGVAYLGLRTGLKEKKGTTLSVVGWTVGVLGVAKGLMSLSRLYTLATEPAPVPAPAPTPPPAEGTQAP